MLEKVEKYILYLTAFLLPLAVIPVFPNPFGLPKIAVLSFGVALLILVKAISTLLKGELTIRVGKFDVAVLLIAIVYTASAIIATPNIMDAFLLPGTATVVLSSAILYFFVNQLSKAEKKSFLYVLLGSGLVFSVILLLSYARVFSRIPQLPNFMKDPTFNPLGGSLPASLFLGALLPLSVGLLIKEKDAAQRLFLGVSALILILALGVAVFISLPGKATSPRLPDYQTSWSVTIDTLKESPLLGTGPGNYLTAFNRFRPLSYNQTDNWSVRFTSARNFYLTSITETGLLGALALLVILLAVYRSVGQDFRNNLQNLGAADHAQKVSLTLLLVLFAFFSATPALIALLFVLLAINSDGEKTRLNLSAQASNQSSAASKLPALLVTIPLIVAVAAFFFYAQRAVAAEMTFNRAINALAQNDGRQTYELMRESIQKNPYVDRYHASYAQVNLALAQNIAQQENISDQDRQTVAQLIQQAIREAKATVTLNPTRAGNWELLARTYQSIMAFAQGADQFAIQSFNQAIALDPINPNLRIALGGVHYSLGRYDDAIRVFELSTVAKPDLANAHYNLAAALREKGEIERAINELTIVLSLVDRDSQDYQVASQELENLESQRTQGELGEGEELTPPAPADEPAITPPLDLPDDSEPPEAPEGAESSPSPTPSPTPES